MKHSLAIAFLCAVCVAPGIASATMLTGVNAMGDCDGWAIEVSIRWGWSTYQADLGFLVTLADLDGNVVEEFAYDDVVVRPQGGLTTHHLFSGEWVGSHSAPGFEVLGSVRLVGPSGESMLEFSDILDCTVATEDISWSTLKATYH